MNSRSLNDSSINLSNTIKNSKKANQSFLENFNIEANYNSKSYLNTNQDILSNNKYSEIADEQKHYIKDLLKKLQIAKDERKLAEKNGKIIEHRVTLLHNQEKIAVRKFQFTKSRIEQLVENRKFFNEENKSRLIILKRKQEEQEILRARAESIRINRENKKKENISPDRKLKRINSQRNPLNQYISNSPDKKMNNSQSTNKFLDNTIRNKNEIRLISDDSFCNKNDFNNSMNNFRKNKKNSISDLNNSNSIINESIEEYNPINKKITTKNINSSMYNDNTKLNKISKKNEKTNLNNSLINKRKNSIDSNIKIEDNQKNNETRLKKNLHNIDTKNLKKNNSATNIVEIENEINKPQIKSHNFNSNKNKNKESRSSIPKYLNEKITNNKKNINSGTNTSIVKTTENSEYKDTKEKEFNYRINNDIKTSKIVKNNMEKEKPNKIINSLNIKDKKIKKKNTNTNNDYDNDNNNDIQKALNESIIKQENKKTSSTIEFKIKDENIFKEEKLFSITSEEDTNYKRQPKVVKIENKEINLSTPDFKRKIYENYLETRNNFKNLNEKKINSEKENKEMGIDSYTLGKNESELIDIDNKEENNESNKFEKNNNYIMKFSNTNFYKNEKNKLKINNGFAKDRKTIKKENVEMIKKIKQACLKNKVNSQNEFFKEEERKINLNDKKSKLRSEILKQIDQDIKQKEVLKDELKQTEQNKIDFMQRKEAEDSIVNKFHERGFIDFETD